MPKLVSVAVTEPAPATEADRQTVVDPQNAARHDPPQGGARRIHDFRDLARRISTWTTNLLAISILAVGALATAGRLTEWWRAEPPGSAVFTPDPTRGPWDDPGELVLVFGDQPWSIRRQSLAGSVDDASHALLEQCRDVLNKTASPASLSTADASEQSLLERLRDAAPVEEVPDRWRLYAIGGPLPWIVGTSTASDKTQGASQSSFGAHDAGANGRLLCWGLALPRPEQGWTLYVFDRRPADTRGGDLPEVPLPSTARRSLRVVGFGGSALTTFSGTGPATRWIVEFDDALATGGWQRLGDWNHGRTSHTASYQRDKNATLLRLEITLTQGPDSRWLGVAETHRLPAGPTTESDAP